MLMEYASVGAFFAIALGFVFAAMVAGWFVRPHKLYDKKIETYECGEEPVGQAWFNFNPRFYIIALIYIVFDVEIAFIYPVATVFKRWVSQGSGWFALIEMLVFIAILLIGLGYVWAKGDLDWIRHVKAGDRRGAKDVVSTAKPSTGGASLKQATAAQEH